MKHLTSRVLGSAIFFFFCLTGTAQEDYTMFLGMYLDPVPGKSVDLMKGVKAHNDKYHKEGDDKAYLWAVLTGPRSGQFAWGQGPIKYAKLDQGLSEEHSLDWDANVGSNCQSVGEIRTLRRLDDHSYNPENEVVGKNVIARIFYGVTDRGDALQVIMMIKEVLEAKKANYARRVYVTDFQTREREDIMLIYPFESWTEMESRRGLEPNFQGQFDEVHGEGAWEKNVTKLQAATEGWYDEVRTLME